MKLIVSLLFFISLILTCHSGVFLERQPMIPGHEGQCYDKDEKVFYKPGQEMKWHGEECARKVCAVSFGTGPSYIEIQTCGRIAPNPACQIRSDPSKPYPECCGWVICPEPIDFSFDSENNIDD